MDIETFLTDYLTKITTSEKLDFLYKEAQKLIESDKRKEATLISVFIELLSDNLEEAERKFNAGRYLSDNELIRLIAEGNYFLIKGRREYNSSDLNNSIKSLKDAISIAGDIPYISIRLARAYRYLGSLTKGEKEAKKNFYESTRLIEEALAKTNDSNKIALSYFYNELGNTYLDMREYTSAENSFSEAIKANNKVAFAYIGMGNYYRTQDEYMKAIKSYNKALELFHYKSNNNINHKECVYPLNYIGDCYRFIEDYERAVDKYIKAINIDPNHAYPWHGLGRVHYELGNRNSNNTEYYEMALEYFIKAKDLNPSFKYVLSSLGSLYDKMGDNKEAIRYYKEAIGKIPKSKHHDEWAARRITQIRNKELFNKKIKNIKEKGHSKYLFPEEKIIIDTIYSEIDEKVALMKNNFAQTFLKVKFYDNEADKEKVILEILRRWNSYTPIITDNSKGGGYFIKAYDKGIVIDPGFNFIDNFKDTGHGFSDIDIVLISHAHDDHTADLESIINLLYRYNKELKSNKILKQIAKEKNTSIYTINEDDKEVKKRYNKFKKVLFLYISEGVMKKYLPYFENEINEEKRDGYILKNGESYNKEMNHTYVVKELRSQGGHVENINKCDEEGINDTRPIELMPIKAKHEDVIKGVESIGYRIDFDNTVFIYTGDSGWSLELEKQYMDIGNQCRENGKDIILLAHIGGFEKKENNLINNLEGTQIKSTKRESKIYKEDKKRADLYLYDNHLGRIGIVKINEILKPKICIISEFGEEFKGLRREVVKAIEEAFKHNDNSTYFIPADIGLKIDLKKLEINVIIRIDYEKCRLIYEYVAPELVEIGEYKKLNQLFYFKKNSGITENDCLQALYDGFTEEKDDCCTIEKYRYLKKLLLNT